MCVSALLNSLLCLLGAAALSKHVHCSMAASAVPSDQAAAGKLLLLIRQTFCDWCHSKRGVNFSATYAPNKDRPSGTAVHAAEVVA